MEIVFHHPMCVAGQSVLAGQRGKMAAFQSAETALGRSPQRTVAIKLKPCDPSVSQSIGGGVRCADLAVLEIRHTAPPKSNPQPAAHRVRKQTHTNALLSEDGPGSVSDHLRVRETK